MKKKLSTVLLALAAFMPMTAQNLVKGDYGYLYCPSSTTRGVCGGDKLAGEQCSPLQATLGSMRVI